jgi:penicillin-binding protein 2
MGHHGSPPLRTAITKSCDGYYYRLGLKMGIDGLTKMVEEFEFDKKTGVDLPGEYTSRTPKYFRASVEKNTGKWLDIDSVFSSIGQVYVEVTPLALLRAVASVGTDGKMYVPHLLKEMKEIGAVGDIDSGTYRDARPAKVFDYLDAKNVPLTPDHYRIILDGMIGAVRSGTAKKAAMGGLEIAGKTGTAQVAELGMDKGHKKDHSWFVSFAPAEKPEIAIVALIENAGFGGDNAAPAARGVYEAYLQVRSRYAFGGQPQIALNTSDNSVQK